MVLHHVSLSYQPERERVVHNETAAHNMIAHVVMVSEYIGKQREERNTLNVARASYCEGVISPIYVYIVYDWHIKPSFRRLGSTVDYFEPTYTDRK